VATGNKFASVRINAKSNSLKDEKEAVIVKQLEEIERRKDKINKVKQEVQKNVDNEF
jgi:hypothetical protein